MSEELNIGDYVRFDYHRVTVPILIGKIVHIEYDKAEKHCFYVTDGGLVIGNENIIKSSRNIIDLIQVGDYVNGDLVYYRPDSNRDEKRQVTNTDMCGMVEYIPITSLYKIKSIVTKEQFEALEYKVDE